MTTSPDRDIAVREHVLLDLAKRDKTDPGDTFRGITEGAALALDVGLARIWRLMPDRSALVCEDLFIRDEHRHESGEVLRASEHPRYFEQLQHAPMILADDARVDPRTSELTPDFLAPRDVTSKMDVPIWHHGTLFGIVSHEQRGTIRHWREDEAAFAGNLADIISASVDASERHAFETRWASVIDGVGELVLVLDGEGHIIQASPRSQQVLEVRIGGVWLALEDRKRHLEFRELGGRIIPHAEWPGERALRGEEVHQVHGVWSKRGDFIGYFRVIMKPLIEDNHVSGVLCLLSDITKDIEFESIKDQFLAALGRELEAPVSEIRRDAAVAARDAVEPTWRGKLDAIGRAAGRMERVIEDLIEISNVRLGTVGLTLEPLDMADLVTSQVQRLRTTVVDRSIRVIASGTAPVVGDQRRLEQAIRRLVGNAVRYSPQGGDIEVHIVADARNVVISIRDRGIGIPADKQPLIFNMFYRAHARTPHDYGGLGIGLYLSREIARLHGGDLWFDSVEGGGSTFYMRLPRASR